MNLEKIILQLKAAAPIFDGRVAGAADFAKGLEGEGLLHLPAAYVVPMDEEATENDEQNALYQVITERIGVIVEFDNRDDRRGQNVTSHYDTMRAALWRALLNWNPDPDRAPRGMRYGGGRFMEMDRARLFYQWDFLLETQVTDADGVLVTGTPLLEIDANTNPGDPPFAARVVLPQP